VVLTPRPPACVLTSPSRARGALSYPKGKEAAGAAGKKTKKAKKDPNAPKRPLSSYMIFSQVTPKP